MNQLQQKFLKAICVFLEVDDCDCVTCKKAKTTMLDSITKICIEEKIELLLEIDRSTKGISAIPLSEIESKISELQNQLNNLK